MNYTHICFPYIDVCSRYYPNMCEVNIIQNNILWGWGMWVLVKVLRLANGLWLNQFTGVENIVIFLRASAATSEAFLFNDTAIYNIFTWACISTDNIAWGLASHQYEWKPSITHINKNVSVFKYLNWQPPCMTMRCIITIWLFFQNCMWG